VYEYLLLRSDFLYSLCLYVYWKQSPIVIITGNNQYIIIFS